MEGLVDWTELEASFAKRGLRPKAAEVMPDPVVGSKRRSSTSVTLSSPKKQAVEKPDTSSQSKPKRIIKSAEAAAAVPRKAQSVPLDSEGMPILPITCGIVTVHNLGTIVSDRSTFHNKRYIWPAGYRSSRSYLSATDKDTQTVYFSEIVDTPAGPSFEVYSEDNPDQKYQSNSSTGVWSTIVKLANGIRGKEYSNSASGPDFFGFSNSTIAMMIEMLPGVDACANYQRKNFELTSSQPRSKSISGTNDKDVPSSSVPLPSTTGAGANDESDGSEGEDLDMEADDTPAADLMSLATHAFDEN